MNFINISQKFVPEGPINKFSTIGSDNDLVGSRQQAIVWSNDIKNNAWVTVNNDFWVTSEAICQ